MAERTRTPRANRDLVVDTTSAETLANFVSESREATSGEKVQRLYNKHGFVASQGLDDLKPAVIAGMIAQLGMVLATQSVSNPEVEGSTQALASAQRFLNNAQNSARQNVRDELSRQVEELESNS